MTNTTYEQCLREMFGLQRFGIKLGLDIIGGMLDGLGHPEKRFSCIHIAGTNGKGSIASALSTILHSAGYRVGLYTSPHLVRFNERICINNEQITDEAVVEIYQAVKDAASGDREPTFFEYTTAMALYAFGRAGVDWAVIETGMGGRLDATNILKPELCVITNISLEHRFYLGNTIAEIAGEKGGIIKHGTPVVTGARQKSAIEVLTKIAQEKKAPFFRLGDHFRIRRQKTLHNGHQFHYAGLDNAWPGMQTSLRGAHQLDNAALVLAACEVLMREGVTLDIDIIKHGLKSVKWPGRLEILPTVPPMIIDGAHNLIAARRLAAFLKDYAAGRRITLVIGILDDKPYTAMLKCLLPLCRRVILTRAKIDRSLPAETLLPAAQRLNDSCEVVSNVADAVNHAVSTTDPDDLICIAGSLYVVGEAKEVLEKRNSAASTAAV